MNTVIICSHRTFILAALFAVACASAVSAQQLAAPQYSAKLQSETLDRLADKANQVVDVNLDERLLQLVPRKLLLNSKDANAREVGQIVAGLKGIYVKNYEFDNDGEYAEGDVAGVRAQLKSPGWSRLVNVSNKREGKRVEVYLMTTGARVDGLAVLAFEPRQLTLVNIVGVIDIDKLSKLEGQFGIPELDIEKGEPTKKQ